MRQLKATRNEPHFSSYVCIKLN